MSTCLKVPVEQWNRPPPKKVRTAQPTYYISRQQPCCYIPCPRTTTFVSDMAPIHLLAVVHGMWGNPVHMAELKRIMLETKDKPNAEGEELRLLVAETNRDDSTYDGIDFGGERVVEEIMKEVGNLEDQGHTVVKFSITGYSLGGLISRYVIGALFKKDFFSTIAPINFNTIATPHLGLPIYPTFISRMFSRLGPVFLSRTGEQFYCVDDWMNTGMPLIQIMADPERAFYRALASFKHKRIYANAVNDRTVPYITAAFETDDPFAEHMTNGISIQLEDGYSPIIKSYTLPDTPPVQPPKPKPLSLSWFRNLSRRTFLPPFLQFRFPLNIVFYLCLPIFIPVVLGLVVVRFSTAARSSRSRIKLLEKDQESHIAHLIATFEREVENAVADIIDDPGNPGNDDMEGVHGADHVDAPAPVLTPLQRSMAKSLNKIPGLEKKLAFLDLGFNSHATIISRDIRRFPMHKLGEGVIRHWADSFEL